MSDTGVMERLIAALNANTAALSGKGGGGGGEAARPASKPAAKKGPKADLETVVKKAGELAETKGKAQAKALVDSFGAAKSRDLKPDSWDAFIEAADALLSSDDTPAAEDDDV